MTFYEFFKKKRIDLTALEKAEPALFSEFKTHFEQMGEKSFDHTKKYWFNKLRRQYQLAPEIKTEKVHIANPLAEQTITESLTGSAPAAPPPKMGFVPKFRASAMPKPAEPVEEKKEEPAFPVPTENIAEIPAYTATPKSAYQPRFKMKPKEETTKTPEAPAPPLDSPKNITTEETPAVKPAYKPRFNMNTIPPKPSEE